MFPELEHVVGWSYSSTEVRINTKRACVANARLFSIPLQSSLSQLFEFTLKGQNGSSAIVTVKILRGGSPNITKVFFFASSQIS